MDVSIGTLLLLQFMQALINLVAGFGIKPQFDALY